MTSIIWKTPFRYKEGGASELLADIRSLLMGKCMEAWIFGSFARNEQIAGSDLDLIVIVETDQPFTMRPRMFDELWNLHPNIDLLVYTPQEWGMMASAQGGFWKSVHADKVRLI